jgi:hypothetical protein
MLKTFKKYSSPDTVQGKKAVLLVPEELSCVDLGFLEEDGNAEVHERLCEVDHRLPGQRVNDGIRRPSRRVVYKYFYI